MAAVRSVFTWATAAVLWAGACLAQASAPFDDLAHALRLSETAEGLSEEGIAYGIDLAAQMLPDGGGAGWPARLGRIYAPQRMEQFVLDRMQEEIAPEDLPAITGFFASDLGQKIIGLELAARKAFIDPDVEPLARERFKELARDDAPVVGLIHELIKDSDLVTFNVMGILNSNLTLYRGLVDGRALEMTEEEILQEVWSQEDSVREDSQLWLEAYFLTAYQGLTEDELTQYADFWRTDSGRAFNRASFAAYDRLYEELSYLLGRAVADQMFGQDL